MHMVTATEKERLAYLTRNDPSDTILLLDALKTIQGYNLDAKPEDRIGTPEDIAACFAELEKSREDTPAATLVALYPNEAAPPTPKEPVKHAFITTCRPIGGSTASSAKDVERGAVLTLPRPVRLHKRKGSKMAPSMLVALDNAPSTTTGQVIRHIQMNAKKRESEVNSNSKAGEMRCLFR